MYVVDFGNSRILHFSQSGEFLDSFGTEGSGENQFMNPVSLEFGPDGKLYIVDHRNHRIVRYDLDGFWEDSWGSEGTGEHQLMYPMDIAFDVEGNIYIADWGNCRIQILSPEFELLGRWGTCEKVGVPRAIAFDLDGNLLIVESSQSKVQVFTANGTFVKSYGIPHTAQGQFFQPADVLIGMDDRIYVLDMGNGRTQVFSMDGSFIEKLEFTGVSIAQDSNGILYLVDFNDRVSKYDIDGNFIASWGKQDEEYNGEQGEFLYAREIVVESIDTSLGPQDQVYVLDNADRIQVFKTDGTYLFEIGITGAEDAKLSQPSGMAVDHDGTIYVADNFGSRLKVFTPDGTFLRQITDTDGFLGAATIDLTPNGDLYFVNSGVIYIMDTDTFDVKTSAFSDLSNIGTIFQTPWGSDLSIDGRVYIPEMHNGGMVVFQLPEPTAQAITSKILNGMQRLTETTNLIENGGFEGLEGWTMVGTMPVELSDIARTGQHSLHLGKQDMEGQGYAKAHTIVNLPKTFFNPELSFYYQVAGTDTKETSDLFVEITDGLGLNHLKLASQVGGKGAEAGTWVEARANLSEFSGQTIRLTFHVRNRFDVSTGIEALIDDVSIVSTARSIYLPIITR